MPLARKAANRALELDPLLAEAHTSMGAVLGWYDWDFEKSNRAYRRAIELDPANALAHYWFALNLDYTNRKSDARAQHDIALRLDPLALQLRNGLANHLQFWGETDAAIRVYEESLRIDPAFHNARRWLGLTYLQAGRPEESLATLDDLPEGFSDDSGVRGWAYALLGQSEKATQVLSEARSETAVDLVYIAGAYAELGLMDEAFGVLQHGIDERMYPLLQVVFILPSARLRADPRFNDVVTAIGLQEYWPRTQVQ
jgi:serine/threonine-protein kinase